MKTLLFRPFKMLSGWTSLFFGLAIIVITSFVAYLGNMHLDGILDLHVGAKTSFVFSFAEGIIDWLSLTIFILIAGFILAKMSGQKMILVDVFGMQALARFPFLISCLLTFLLFSEKIPQYMEWQLLKKGNEIQIGAWDIIAFVFLIISMLAIIVWSIILMYRAYSLSCNVKGIKGVLSFIVCLILAEVMSKLSIYVLYEKLFF